VKLCHPLPIQPEESFRLLNNMKIVVVMPAYNAEKTLRRTLGEIPADVVDEVILVDDHSHDETQRIAMSMGIRTIRHAENLGYGANQKTCYREALAAGADVVVMVHPDYQYTPKLVTAMAAMITSGEFDAVLGSRILGRGALRGGMPVYKYIANRFLTLAENILINYKLSEYHTGFRAWSRQLLESLPLDQNSDDFVFDNEMLVQARHFGYRIGEISCPTRYFDDASSINFRRSVIYGVGVLLTAIKYRTHVWGLMKFGLFERGMNRDSDRPSS
jgi:glycosyltransferase involved in cell wall biosynthesis